MPIPTITPTCTSTPTAALTPAITSGYYIPTEEQARTFDGGISIPIPAPDWANAKYLSTTPGKFNNNWAENPAQYANEFLLYDHNYACLQGSAQLANGKFITCQNPDKLWWNVAKAGDPVRDSVSFLWADDTQTGLINSMVAFNTVAVCNPSNKGETVQLRGLENDPILAAHGNSMAIFKVVDVGEGLCPATSKDGKNYVDIFTGIGADAYRATIPLQGKSVNIYTINANP